VQISARGDYAVRAALILAAAYPTLMSTQAIAAEQDMPRKFLEAVLADLRRGGVVRAQRGAEGGCASGMVLRAVDGPLAGVRGLRPEETRYDGAAENLPRLWVAVRAAVREVVDEVSLAEVLSGRMSAHVRKLTLKPDAWESR
jgi:Rrf2 family protein